MTKSKGRIVFHTTAWGKYREMYEKYTKPSIQSDIALLKEDGYDCVYSHGGFDLDKAPEKFDTTRAWNKESAILLAHLRATIQDCIDDNSIMVLVMPDTIFGKGSIYNSIKMMEGKNTNIAIPHLRAVPLEKWQDKNPTCRELVDYCFESPHDSFMKSFDNEDSNASWAGISARKLNNKMYTVNHSLPTTYIARFNPIDLRYWEYCMDFGNWDRQWLKILVKDERIKIVGSSDIAFCVELTDADKNVPPVQKGLLNNDKYWEEDDHNKIFKMFQYSLMRS